jgi:hypothetical protein
MPKIITLALVGMLSLALAAPVYAGRGGGGGSHGGRGGGFHGSQGRFHGGGFHHGGRFHRGCCFGPAFVGGVFLGSALAYPYYSPSYSYPYYDPSYSYPAYPDPVYQPQTQLYVTPSVQREVCYVGGCYRLQGDGVTIAYRWIWVPTVPNPPPPPPTAPPTGSPTSGAPAPLNSVLSRPTQQLYRWVDEQGVANWTNNRQAVPQRYRSQLQ